MFCIKFKKKKKRGVLEDFSGSLHDTGREIQASIITFSIVLRHFRKKKSISERDKSVLVSILVTFVASYREGFILCLHKHTSTLTFKGWTLEERAGEKGILFISDHSAQVCSHKQQEPLRITIIFLRRSIRAP